jgi:hypothetical protein
MRTLKRIGPRPILLIRLIAYRVRRLIHGRFFRATYSRRVVAASRGALLDVPPLPLPPVEALPEELRLPARQIRDEAEAILEHRVDLLGSGMVELGDVIDWQCDFKSGYRWPLEYFADVEITRLDDSSDAKVPWELSRGHQLLTLARAAVLYRDERFAVELERQLASWIAANPTGRGINWTNPMEIGIRAVNWVWAIRTLEGWRKLDVELRARAAESLAAHARHIRANLEETPRLRGNHYLGDILGLAVIGWAIRDPAAGRWFGYARRNLEREIRSQVHPDGAGFEASLPYHGLALEMFALARIALDAAGQVPSPGYDEQLGRMIELSRSVRHPSGRTPQIGDTDSGRILPAGFARPPAQDAQMWLAAAALGRARPLSGGVDEEVAWTLGVESWTRAAALPPANPPAAAFPHGGLYVLADAGIHSVVRCGDVGQRGYGGHAHNDALSYELSIDGLLIALDSGTYTYTADHLARARFRATAAHNTVTVDGCEINPIDPTQVFELRQCTQPTVEDFVEGPDQTRLVARHDGFRPSAGAPTIHRRAFELDKRAGVLRIIDDVTGAGEHMVESFVHLSPGLDAKLGETTAELSREGQVVVRISWSDGWTAALGESWISHEYGVRQPAPVLTLRRHGPLPARLALVYEPVAVPAARQFTLSAR